MLCFVGAGLAYWLDGSGPDHPNEWDSRVDDLVDFVEADRGHEFDHPVQVNFLSPEEYSELTAGDGSDEPSDEERADADDQTALFRALGLMSGEVDLIQSSTDLFEGGTAAFYDSELEQIYVNGVAEGEQMSVGTKVTVVHELTHALQDQMVDLDSIDEDIDTSTTDWADSHLAIVEGDASVVEQNYVAELSEDDFDAYIEEWDQLVDDSEEAKADAEVPAALDVFFGLPYVFGPSWVVAAQASDDGQGEIDRALDGEVPPSVAILDLTVGGPAATSVDAPRLAEGSEEIYTDSFGAMSWLVVLGEHADASTAIDAVSTWKGDEIIVFRDDQDRVCFNGRIQVDDRGEPVTDGSFASAARSWQAALPAESEAKVSVDDDLVTMYACDPGPDVEIPLTGTAQLAVDELGLRNGIVTSVLAEGGVDLEWAECYATALIDAFGVEALNSSDDTLVSSPEFTQQAAKAAMACGLPD